MRNVLLCAAFAVAAVGSTQALAAQPGAVNPPVASTGSATDTTATSGLKVGLSVKDSTGATIGHLTELKADATGKKMATIHMGADNVSIEADRLTVKDGAATVNATKAELQGMAKKPKG
jgi:hypothetical protein